MPNLIRFQQQSRNVNKHPQAAKTSLLWTNFQCYLNSLLEPRWRCANSERSNKNSDFDFTCDDFVNALANKHQMLNNPALSIFQPVCRQNTEIERMELKIWKEWKTIWSSNSLQSSATRTQHQAKQLRFSSSWPLFQSWRWAKKSEFRGYITYPI